MKKRYSERILSLLERGDYKLFNKSIDLIADDLLDIVAYLDNRISELEKELKKRADDGK